MDIDEFYEGDPRRRASAELELGTEWMDADNVRHELNYVEDTGELYVLREPAPHVSEDPFGGLYVQRVAGLRQEDDGARDREDPHQGRRAPDPRGLAGGDGAPEGPVWLGDRLRAAGVAVGPAGTAIEDDGPDLKA